jgi:hypothetical protein
MEREMRSRGEEPSKEEDGFLLPHYKTFNTKAGRRTTG